MHCSTDGILFVFLQKITFIHRKIRTKTVARRAAVIGLNMHRIVRGLRASKFEPDPREGVYSARCRGPLLRKEGVGRKLKGGVEKWRRGEESSLLFTAVATPLTGCFVDIAARQTLPGE